MRCLPLLVFTLLALPLLLAPPALAAEGYLQGLSDGESVCLVAAVRDGAAELLPDPESAGAPDALGPGEWTLADLAGPAGRVRGSAPVLGECGCLLQAQVSLVPRPAMTGLGIASNLPLRPPAKLERLPVDSAAYVKAARAWLDEQGLTQAPVRLTHVLRTDLEGDGVDEVLLAGAYGIRSVEDADMAVGRYAFLLLRKLVEGAVVTSALEAYADPQPYGYEQAIEGLVAIEPVAVLDLTGDGVAEVVAGVWLHEGLAFTLYQAEGPGMAARAECGCGC